jgi:hypothetical protein
MRFPPSQESETGLPHVGSAKFDKLQVGGDGLLRELFVISRLAVFQHPESQEREKSPKLSAARETSKVHEKKSRPWCVILPNSIAH